MVEAFKGRLKLMQGDITKIIADAIVNAANSSLMGGGGVDGAIHLAGGSIILDECKEYVLKHGKLPTGEAMITHGGNLPAQFIIHTVGPVWNGGTNNESQLLQNAYRNSLELAVKQNLKTIAFPNISTGIYHFPKDLAAEIAVDTSVDFLRSNLSLQEVIFVCYDDENFQLYKEKMNALERE